MRRRRSPVILIALAGLMLTKIIISVMMIREHTRHAQELKKLADQTEETAKKSKKACQDMVQLCEKITQKPCGECK